MEKQHCPLQAGCKGIGSQGLIAYNCLSQLSAQQSADRAEPHLNSKRPSTETSITAVSSSLDLGKSRCASLHMTEGAPPSMKLKNSDLESRRKSGMLQERALSREQLLGKH